MNLFIEWVVETKTDIKNQGENYEAVDIKRQMVCVADWITAMLS